MKVSIVVTHLLGTGHLARALTLGRAYGAAGHDVQVVSGGMPAPQLNSDGVDVVQLPPLRSDARTCAMIRVYMPSSAAQPCSRRARAAAAKEGRAVQAA